MDVGTKLFQKLIIDGCGYKTISKVDNWLMRVQNYSETW